MRKEHNESGCTACGPEREAYEYWNEPFDGGKILSETKLDDGRTAWTTVTGRSEFVHKKRQSGLPWWRLPKEEDPQYVDPNVSLTGRNKVDAILLGVQDLRKLTVGYVDMPHPSLKIALRRQRKKLRAGKPVKKHRDRPYKNQGY